MCVVLWLANKAVEGILSHDYAIYMQEVVALQAQVCAAGALLNILGPELERSKAGVFQRKGFGRIMSCLLTLSVVCETMFEGAYQVI